MSFSSSYIFIIFFSSGPLMLLNILPWIRANLKKSHLQRIMKTVCSSVIETLVREVEKVEVFHKGKCVLCETFMWGLSTCEKAVIKGAFVSCFCWLTYHAVLGLKFCISDMIWCQRLRTKPKISSLTKLDNTVYCLFHLRYGMSCNLLKTTWKIRKLINLGFQNSHRWGIRNCVFPQMKKQMHWGDRASLRAVSWWAVTAWWPITTQPAPAKTNLWCKKMFTASRMTILGMRRMQ